MATKVSKKNQDDDELDQLSDNNMEICDMCKKPGRILCCDYCYRSFHGDCGASGVNTGRTWKCPVCIQRESERCKNSGEFLPDPQATLVYQCSCCAAKYSPVIRLLASSADVPLWLIVTSKTNLCHFFDISQRQEVYDLILQGSNAYKQLKDLVLRAACFENKQKHLFHVCNQCTAKSRKKILIEQKSFEGKSFARVRLANQSELHDQWIKVKPADILAPSSGENCTDSRVERIVAWHRYARLTRPPQQARKSHREMLEWIRNRDLSSMSLGSADCLSFYVKWHTHDEIFCTWESEYFLRFYYKYIFDFALKKVFEDEEKLHQDKSFAKQLTKDSLLQISKSVSPLISEKTRQWAKKLLKQDEEGADILVDAADGYQQALLSYVSLLKEKSLDQPILLVTQKKNAKNWAGILDLFFPNIESLRLLNSSKTCIEYEVLRFELFQTGSTPKFDLLLTEESTFNKLTNQIMSLDWKVIILDLPEKSCESVLALSYFNKPYHRASSRRVAVFPNKGQLLSQYDYSLLHFLTNSKAITQILPRVFSENNPHVLEFRLLKGKKVNCSLSAKALKPILVSGPSQGAPAAACVEYRNIILRYSDSMKLHLQEQIHQSIDALVERSRPKLLELLAEVLTCLERGVFTSKSDENKYLENDVKLRFAIKLIERSRQEGRMDKVVFVFPTPMSQIRCAPNLQKLCKYCYWQVIEMSDAFEIQTEVANFNKVDKKFTVLSIVSSELSRVEGIRCSNFILYGFDGVDAQSQIQVPSADLETAVLRGQRLDGEPDHLEAGLRRHRGEARAPGQAAGAAHGRAGRRVHPPQVQLRGQRGHHLQARAARQHLHQTPHRRQGSHQRRPVHRGPLSPRRSALQAAQDSQVRLPFRERGQRSQPNHFLGRHKEKVQLAERRLQPQEQKSGLRAPQKEPAARAGRRESPLRVRAGCPSRHLPPEAVSLPAHRVRGRPAAAALPAHDGLRQAADFRGLPV